MVAFDGASKYRAELKNVLFTIDGKTPTHTLLAELKGFDDPSGLLAELESEGLIEAKGLLQRATPRTEYDDAIWGAQSAAFAESSLENILPNSGFDATTPAPLYGTQSVPNAQKVLENLTRQITDAMSSFILVHLPQHAFDMLGELERVRTPEQLRLVLPSYSFLVQSTGAEGVRHLRNVQDFIAQRL